MARSGYLYELSMKQLRQQGIVGSRFDFHIADNAEKPACVVYDYDDGTDVAVLPIECDGLAEAMASWLSRQDDARLGI